MTGFILPCIRAYKVPVGPDWVHEIKQDGYRLQVRRVGLRLVEKGVEIDGQEVGRASREIGQQERQQRKQQSVENPLAEPDRILGLIAPEPAADCPCDDDARRQHGELDPHAARMDLAKLFGEGAEIHSFEAGN